MVRAVPVTGRRVPQALDVGFERRRAGAVARKLLLANHDAACGIVQPIPATHLILRVTPIVAECRREGVVTLTAERASGERPSAPHSKPAARLHGQKFSRIGTSPQITTAVAPEAARVLVRTMARVRPSFGRSRSPRTVRSVRRRAVPQPRRPRRSRHFPFRKGLRQCVRGALCSLTDGSRSH